MTGGDEDRIVKYEIFNISGKDGSAWLQVAGGCRQDHVPLECLFQREKDAAAALARYDAERYAGYVDEMQTVQGLARFAWGHGLNGCGWDVERVARQAYRDRCMELLGIVLD